MKCGTIVTIKISKIQAMITCISKRFTNTQYELTYYVNGECKPVWCHKEEFEIIETNKIGFNNGK